MTTEELLAQLTDLDRLHAAGTDMSGKAPLAGARGLFINALLDGVDPEHPGVWPVLSSALKALATENAEWAQRYDRLQDERELAYVEVADLTDRLTEATALLEDAPKALAFLIRQKDDALRDYADALEAMEKAEKALEAANRYDQAITGKAVRGEYNLREGGGAVAEGDDLDALYFDWQAKVKGALAALRKAIGKEVEQPDD